MNTIMRQDMIICKPGAIQLKHFISKIWFNSVANLKEMHYKLNSRFSFQIFMAGQLNMYNLQTSSFNLKTRWKQFKKTLYRNKRVNAFSHNLKPRKFELNVNIAKNFKGRDI